MASLQSNSTFSFKHHLTGEDRTYVHSPPFPSKTFSFKHHFRGEACFIQTPLDRRGMASLQSNSTFSFKHHSANGIRCSSNIAIADHFPSKGAVLHLKCVHKSLALLPLAPWSVLHKVGTSDYYKYNTALTPSKGIL